MKFRKKPVVIEATQWMKEGDHPFVMMCWFDALGRVRWAPGDSEAINIYGCIKKPAIATLEGWHAVTPGDYIITGIKGEHYPCKPDIFKATYETVEEPVACECHRCIKEKDLRDPSGMLPLNMSKMILCAECGNKRCPKASDHMLACTGSNEPGQSGSVYAHPPRREWKSLSEEDMEDLLPLYSDPSANTEMLEFAAAIEVKLKEKNA